MSSDERPPFVQLLLAGSVAKTRPKSSRGFRAARGFSSIDQRLESLLFGVHREANFAAAAAAFSTACLIRVPLKEVIKTRMQTSTYGALSGLSLAAAQLVLANNGFRRFWNLCKAGGPQTGCMARRAGPWARSDSHSPLHFLVAPSSLTSHVMVNSSKLKVETQTIPAARSQPQVGDKRHLLLV
ncbi:hypothetical protein BDZ97DRAFT_1996906 [Flammula alnicola]|nr:hypothetical protein BDZ97DRAFT_1996906 [Flammula alnicola]